MPVVAGGKVGAANSAPVAVAEPPLLSRLVEVPDRSQAPTGEVYRYLTDQGRFHQHKITARAGDADHLALTAAVLSYPEHSAGVIQFEDYAFGTRHRSVRDWLDREIADALIGKIGRIGIDRDTAQLRTRCTRCDKIVFNTKAGMAELALHMLEAHTDEDGTPLPVEVPDG
jgi:hypothetical protein